MDEIYSDYKIFDFSIKSNILIPELTHSAGTAVQLSFILTSVTPEAIEAAAWVHHWLLPNGERSLSLAKTKSHFIIRFPRLADFLFSPTESSITCHPTPDTPQETIRHLLLDQVIPRIVGYLGRPVIHASGVVINNTGVLFLGETGWGKSTICAFFHQRGFPLLNDDCVLLEKDGDGIIGIPSYEGMRLLDDSLQVLHYKDDSDHNIQNVSHYSTKKRIIFRNKPAKRPLQPPIKVLLVLNDPNNYQETPLLFSRITGSHAALELVKHCFHMDPTNVHMMGKQLLTITDFLASNKLAIFTLNFQRKHELLPSICEQVTSFVTSFS